MEETSDWTLLLSKLRVVLHTAFPTTVLELGVEGRRRSSPGGSACISGTYVR